MTTQPGALRRSALAGAVALGLALGACGGQGPSRFGDEADAVREAVQSGNRTAAVHALESLQADAQAAQAEGQLDESDMNEINSLIYESRLLIDQVLPPPTTAPTTTAAVSSTTQSTRAPAVTEKPKPKRTDEGPGHGKGRDKKGHD